MFETARCVEASREPDPMGILCTARIRGLHTVNRTREFAALQKSVEKQPSLQGVLCGNPGPDPHVRAPNCGSKRSRWNEKTGHWFFRVVFGLRAETPRENATQSLVECSAISGATCKGPVSSAWFQGGWLLQNKSCKTQYNESVPTPLGVATLCCWARRLAASGAGTDQLPLITAMSREWLKLETGPV